MSNVTTTSRVGGSYSGGSVNRKSTVAKTNDEFIDQVNSVEYALSYNGLDQDGESKGKQQEQKEEEKEKQFISQNALVANIYEAQEADELYIQQNQASRQINVYDSNNDILFDDHEENESKNILKRNYFEYDELAE